MGGKVLDYEAKTIYMDGKNDGIALGMAKGVAQGISGAGHDKRRAGDRDYRQNCQNERGAGD